MITSDDCFKRYGAPELEKNMVLWDIPQSLELGVIPKRLYCNKDIVVYLEQAFKAIIDRKLIAQLKTWDGCFNIRAKRGASSASLHSWGIAIDINAAWNRFGQAPTISKELVQCFTDCGFEWGGNWHKPDGMHFQLSKWQLDLISNSITRQSL